MANTNLSCAITQLSAQPNHVTSGSTVEIKVSFSEQACPIQPGDTITVSWPSTGEAYLNAYNQTFPLIDPISNLVLANVVVTNGEATITFTQHIPQLQKVSGSIEFKAVAWNVTDVTTEDTKTIHITSGDKSIPVTITKPEYNDQPTDFYSKTASIWPNDSSHIYWYLNTNTRRENVEQPLTITDHVQPGQSIVPDSFMIYNTSNSEFYEGPNAIAEFEAAHPDSSISYNLDTSTINVTLSPFTVNGINWIILFKTHMDDLNQKTFSNKSTINYWVKGTPAPETVQSNASINNPFAEGDISGAPAGTLIIKKLLDRSDSSTVNLPLSGVSFQLSRVDGAPLTPGGPSSVVLTTNASGEAQFTGLTDGEYKLVEVYSPNWINPIPDPITFNMTDANIQGVKQTIKNTKKLTSVSATKTWHTPESPPPQVWFKLYRSNGIKPLAPVPNAPIKPLAPGTTLVSWPDLELADDIGNVYTYTVKEVNAQGEDFTPLGYKKQEDGLSVINTYQNETTSLQVSKNWVDGNNQDGLRPTSVSVTLLANGQPTTPAITLSATNNWQYTWSNLPAYKQGEKVTYSVQETAIPQYETSYENTSEQLITITNTHTPATTSLAVSKLWNDHNNQDGLRPSSVVVTLLQNGVPSSFTATLSEANNWQYIWNNLPMYKDGKLITYTAQENPIPHYTASYENPTKPPIITPDIPTDLFTSLKVSKVWQDTNNQAGLRPTSVAVRLLANGQPLLPPVTLNAQNNWHYQWTNLPAYAHGMPILYSVEEAPLTHYQTSYAYSNPHTMILTNTLIVPNYHPSCCNCCNNCCGSCFNCCNAPSTCSYQTFYPYVS